MEQITFSNLRKTETAQLEQNGVSITAETVVADGVVSKIEGSMIHSTDNRLVHFNYFRNNDEYKMAQDGSASLLSENYETLDGFISSVITHYTEEE